MNKTTKISAQSPTKTYSWVCITTTERAKVKKYISHTWGETAKIEHAMKFRVRSMAEEIFDSKGCKSIQPVEDLS